MRQKIEKYLENFNKVISLDDMNDYHQKTKEELFQILLDNAVIKQNISLENNQILADILKPLEEKKELTSKEREDVEYFFHSLRKGFESLDNGILYRLSKLLLEDSILKNDLDKIIEGIYYFSYYEYVLQSLFPREERNCSWDKVLDYVDRYDELSTEGKKNFLRCYGNRILSKEYSYELHKEIYDFIMSKKEKEPNLDIPYDTYLFVIDKNICSGIELIRNSDATGETIPEALIEGVYTSACRIHENITKVSTTSLPVYQVYEYTYHAIRFHKHLITIDEFLKELKKLAEVKPNYTLQQKTSAIVKMNTYWIFYLRYKYDKAEDIKKAIDPTVLEILAFIRTIKPSDYTRNMNSDILSFLQTISNYYPYDFLEELYIKTTTKRHTPTLIHTLSVAEISRMLTEAMLEKKPEFFKGIVDNYSVEYICSHKKEISELSYQMGIMHDIGKYYCIPIISINYRRLEDAEFQTIKQHPFCGYRLAKNSVPDPIRDAMLYHHLWHNHKGGYPMNNEPTMNQPLIDILSIADSIDAAVDFLGRSYAKRKTLQDLVNEFQAFKDTRYSKDVIELLDDPNLFQRIETFLNEGRHEIGYKAFCQEL